MTAAEVTALYEKRLPTVRRMALRMLKHPDDAEDAAQSVFLRLLETQEQFRGECSFETWLYRVAENEILRLLRMRSAPIRGRAVTVSLESVYGHDGFEPDAYARKGMVHPALARHDHRLMSTAERLTLLRLLEELPVKLRVPLVLFYFVGADYRTGARIAGATVSAFKMAAYRGKRRLRARLEARTPWAQ